MTGDNELHSVDYPGVRVGYTANGRGLYATRFFSTSSQVGTLVGDIIEDPDYEGSEYAIELNSNQTLEPGAPFRFVNHSCAPNCALVIHECEGEDGEQYFDSAILEVLRPVFPGDELTIDYAWCAEAAIPCYCGSDACREWVVCSSQLQRLHELFGHTT
ncbi:MAG: SET domain-containing protein-lysine N-methyltransferase [Planctomycetota bacterium]